MKSPKVIREKFEQSNLSDIGDQYTSFNLGKGWSMGEQSLKSLKQDQNEQSQTNLLQSQNDFLPKLQFQTQYPGTIQKIGETRHVDGGVTILVQSNTGSKTSIHSKDGETKSSRLEVIQGIKTRDGEENPRAPNTTEI